MQLKVIGSLLKQTFDEWNEDKAPRLGAALAYYAIFSLTPLLLIAISLAGLVFGEQAARGQVAAQLKQTVGEPTASAIEELLKNTQATGGTSLAAVTGLVLLLFGATGLFVQLQDALNTIWKVTPKPGRPWLGLLRDRLLSFLLVLAIAFLLLALLVVSTALSAITHLLPRDALPGTTYAWQALYVVLSVVFTTLFFAIIYQVLPDVRIAWRDVWIGSAFTAVLYTVGKYLLSLYLSLTGTTSAFGAAASLVVILLWVYYSAQIFLFGAEFTRVYADRCGSELQPTKHAVRLTPEQLARQGTPRTQDLAALSRSTPSPERSATPRQSGS